MLNFLGSLFGAGAELAGSAMNTQAQQSMNAQQLQFAQQQASGAFVGQYANALRAAGINPAGGGFSPPSVSMGGTAAQPGAGIGAAGQDISKAIAAMAPTESKTDILQQDLLRSQITHQDLVNSSLAMSQIARGSGAADQPFYGGTGRGIPLPPDDPRGLGRGRPNMWTDYYDNPTGGQPRTITLLSPDAQRSVFSGVPTAPLYPAIASALTGKNVGNWWQDVPSLYGTGTVAPGDIVGP